MTPEQMRALADMSGALAYHDRDRYVAESAAALRAAAYQLEAVPAVLDRAEAENAPHLYPDDFSAILAAGTAPQEERDA